MPFCYLSAANECDVNNGGCDHYCTETLESYTCSCYPGYTLESNGHTCTGMYMDKSSCVTYAVIIITPVLNS